MMMIAFITIKSGLVPLIEGLCPQNYCFRFEIFSGVRSHLLIFFFCREIFERKHFTEQNSQSKISSRLQAYTYTFQCVLCTHIRTEIWSTCILRALQVPHLDPLGSQPSTPSVQCVCVCATVCAYTHTHTHIHSHQGCVENRKDTLVNNTPISQASSVKNLPPRQATSASIN